MAEKVREGTRIKLIMICFTQHMSCKIRSRRPRPRSRPCGKNSMKLKCLPKRYKIYYI